MENLYKKIVDTIPVFFFVWDGDKNETIFISEKFYDHTFDRYYAPETPREDLRQYIAEESQNEYDLFFTSLIHDDDDTANHVELRAIHLPGIEWIKVSTFPVVEEGSITRYTAGHISDITHFRQNAQLLENQVENIDTIIFMLAHELSSPIANMMGLAEYLRIQGENEEHIQPAQLYETIYNRGGEVLTLVRGMISLLNFQFDRSPFILEKVALKPFVGQLIEDFYHKSNAKNITISCSSVSDNATITVETEKFSTAIKEILVFLLKLANNNDVISLSTPVSHHPDQVQLCITSSVTPLPKSAIQALLSRSSRLNLSNVKGRKIRGMLELVVAKEICQLHQGQLDMVDKDDEQGLVITLPRSPDLDRATDS